eukprot:scaffold161411_cov29-Prasinocladus_malaysianus.AAC.1
MQHYLQRYCVLYDTSGASLRCQNTSETLRQPTKSGGLEKVKKCRNVNSTLDAQVTVMSPSRRNQDKDMDGADSTAVVIAVRIGQRCMQKCIRELDTDYGAIISEMVIVTVYDEELLYHIGQYGHIGATYCGICFITVHPCFG